MKNTVTGLFLLIFGFFIFLSTACAVEGKVVLKKNNCVYFIVEAKEGFAILEWYEGNKPDEGDILEGVYDSFGIKLIYNKTKDAQLKVSVDNYWLSKKDAMEFYAEKCH